MRLTTPHWSVRSWKCSRSHGLVQLTHPLQRLARSTHLERGSSKSPTPASNLSAPRGTVGAARSQGSAPMHTFACTAMAPIKLRLAGSSPAPAVPLSSQPLRHLEEWVRSDIHIVHLLVGWTKWFLLCYCYVGHMVHVFEGLLLVYAKPATAGAGICCPTASSLPNTCTCRCTCDYTCTYSLYAHFLVHLHMYLYVILGRIHVANSMMKVTSSSLCYYWPLVSQNEEFWRLAGLAKAQLERYCSYLSIIH